MITYQGVVYECRLPNMRRRVDLEDLIDAYSVAETLGLAHRNSVSTYMHRYADFPQPLIDTSAGCCRLWSRREINSWLTKRDKAGALRTI
jgi:hypothetical protein